jgi:hypothetical protein
MASARLEVSVLAIAALLVVQSTLAAYGVRVVRDVVGAGRAELIAVASAHQSSDSADVK